MAKPYRIIEGHCLESLRRLPAQSVHCMVTSPPYYGLRNYGTTPQIWGGKRKCHHRWTDSSQTRKANMDGIGSRSLNPAAKKRRAQLRAAEGSAGTTRLDSSQTCRKCGAWRGSFGNEPTVQLFVKNLVRIFRALRRALRDDGTVWLNLGDSYAGGPLSPPGTELQAHNQGANAAVGIDKSQSGIEEKNLMGVPWRVALALQKDGWFLRNDIIWAKVNPMPESVRDRCTRSHEHLFLLTKKPRYFYDMAAIAEVATLDEGGAVRNKRDVWYLGVSKVAKQSHFATFPEALVEPCIKAGTSERGCCPKCGAPWVRRVLRHSAKAYSAHHRREVSPGQMDCSEKNKLGHSFAHITTGWQPSCPCFGRFKKQRGGRVLVDGVNVARSKKVYVPRGRQPEPVPCTVLDIFSGSATTGVVALKLRRRYLGLELNPEYVRLGTKRCRRAAAHRNSQLTKLFPERVRPVKLGRDRSAERLF